MKKMYAARLARAIACHLVRQERFWHWREERGSLVGCVLQTELGFYDNAETGEPYLPRWLLYLAQVLSEQIPSAALPSWSLRWFASIPVGVNLLSVYHQFCAFLCEEYRRAISAGAAYARIEGETLALFSQGALLHRSLSLHTPWLGEEAESTDETLSLLTSATQYALRARFLSECLVWEGRNDKRRPMLRHALEGMAENLLWSRSGWPARHDVEWNLTTSRGRPLPQRTALRYGRRLCLLLAEAAGLPL